MANGSLRVLPSHGIVKVVWSQDVIAISAAAYSCVQMFLRTWEQVCILALSLKDSVSFLF